MKLKELGDQIWARHPLAFLVEAADDICYTIIDLEDGRRLGLVSLEQYTFFLSEIIGENFSQEKLDQVASLNEKLGILRAMSIAQLVKECSTLFKENEESILDGNFDKALTSSDSSKGIFEKISEFSVANIYRSRPVLEKEAGGYEVISKLMEAFSVSVYHCGFDTPSPRHKSLFRLLPQDYQLALKKEGVSIYDSLQLVTDYVSSLTDRYAVSLYKTIYGL